ncbi:MAG: glycosyl hydrolase family 28-related protein [Planctomycetota bacterium]
MPDLIESASLPDGVIHAHDFGAVGDGAADDTAAIQAAIDACTSRVASDGRGVVRLATGVYRSGTLRLRDRVTLMLEAGATLRGHEDPEAYSGCRPQGKMSARWYRGLIVAEDTQDAGVCGPGTIDGRKLNDPLGEERMRGPHTVLAARSTGFSIRDLAITDSANYAIMIVNCDDTDVDRVTVTGGWDGLHARGNPDKSCQRLAVTGCRFFTGDDAIAGCWVDDLLVRDCLLNSSCNGIRWIGPARRMIVDSCLIFGPGRHPHRTQGRHNALIGVTLQPSAWEPMPGDLDEIRLTNLTMHRVMSPMMVVAHPLNRIGSIDARRITATGVYGPACSFESWSDRPIERIVLSDVDIDFDLTGPDAAHAVHPLTPGEQIAQPRVGSRALPAWALYARRVNHLDLRDVRLHHTQAVAAPAIRCDGVESLEHYGLRLPAGIATPDAIQRCGLDEAVTKR